MTYRDDTPGLRAEVERLTHAHRADACGAPGCGGGAG
jgi:hypothetical protein